MTEKAWPDAPYKGLNYYSTADAPLFSQREDEIEDVVALLASFDTRVVLLQGATGTGKSSFLRAGLVPRLQTMPPDEGRRYFFLRERSSGSDALLIRTTDDPVARIYEALQSAAKLESVPEGARTEIGRVLAKPIPQDRKSVLPAILAALKALTEPPQRDVFLLLVDQAEEVLTLPGKPGVINAQDAFFELIEQICFRLSDLRVIVALRTEYVGRFNAFLRIRPTNRLTSAAEPRAGLFDYLLPPMGERDIAAAIRHPASATTPDQNGKPRSVYRFSYDERLPDMIAADVVHQSREMSTLPTMQIVCKQLYDQVKDHLPAQITEHDYVKIGRAEGAIDSFVDRALRDSAREAGLPPLDERDIDAWALVLSQVVGRSEGGMVQTLVASEGELVNEAANHDIPSEAARAMLRQLVDPDRRVLRVVAMDGGAVGYSLGHDSLGSSVLRRGTEAEARAAAEVQLAEERKARALAEERAEAQLAMERERSAAAAAQAQARLTEERAAAERRIRDQRYRFRLTLAAAAVLFVLLGSSVALFMVSVVAPMWERARVITETAAREQTNDYHLRLLLLASGLQRGETWPGSWFLDTEPTKEALRKALMRSPIFGGTFDAAAWDASGRRVVRFEDGTLIVHDLESGGDRPAATLPRLENGASVPPSVGLITSGDVTEAVAFRSDQKEPALLAGGASSPLRRMNIQIPAKPENVFITRTDIFGKHVRMLFSRYERNLVRGVQVLQFTKSGASEFQGSGLSAIEWEPGRDQALRLPVLAEDCDDYAFLSRGDDGNGYHVWYGILSRQGGQRSSHFGGQSGLVAGAVTIARGCGAIVALTRDDEATALQIFPKQPEGAAGQSVNLDHLARFTNILFPTWQQGAPMLAAAPRGRGWRVGWATATGLSVVDVDPGRNPADWDCSAATPTNSAGGAGQGVLGVCVLSGVQMLTGTETSHALGTLSLSPDGRYALMTQQQTFSGPQKVRVFDLDMDKRKQALAKLNMAELIREACRVAKLHNENDQLSDLERAAWLGDEKAPQPCGGF